MRLTAIWRHERRAEGKVVSGRCQQGRCERENVRWYGSAGRDRLVPRLKGRGSRPEHTLGSCLEWLRAPSSGSTRTRDTALSPSTVARTFSSTSPRSSRMVTAPSKRDSGSSSRSRRATGARRPTRWSWSLKFARGPGFTRDHRSAGFCWPARPPRGRADLISRREPEHAEEPVSRRRLRGAEAVYGVRVPFRAGHGEPRSAATVRAF